MDCLKNKEELVTESEKCREYEERTNGDLLIDDTAVWAQSFGGVTSTHEVIENHQRIKSLGNIQC